MRLTIVRNTHSGAYQARQLEPYVADADVVSVEAAFLSLQGARKLERALSTGGSMVTQFQRSSRRHIDSDDSASEFEYGAALHRLVVMHRKKVVLLEKFSDREIERAKALFEQAQELSSDSQRLFLSGNFERAADKCLESHLSLVDLAYYRDARSIEHLPRTIGEVRAIKDDAHYVAIIGNKHDLAQKASSTLKIPVTDIHIPAYPYEHLDPRTKVFDFIKKGDNDKAWEKGAYHLAADLLSIVLMTDESVIKFGLSDRRTLGRLETVGGKSSESLAPYYIRQVISTPLSYELAERIPFAALKDFSSLIKRHYPIEDVRALIDPVLSFLAGHGVDTAAIRQDPSSWAQYFPFGKEKSLEPVTTIYTPK